MTEMEHQVLFGVGGYAFSGKDTLADLWVEHCGFHKTYMSKPLEQALLTLDPLVPKTMFDEGRIYESGRGSINGRKYDNGAYERYSALHERAGYDQSKKNKEVRRLLQLLGTEVGRNMLGEDVWVKIVMAEASLWMREASMNVVITGIRYPNEIEALTNLGGTPVWVSRPGTEPVNSHSSDNTLKPEDFDITVTNDGTIEDLKETAVQLANVFIDANVLEPE